VYPHRRIDTERARKAIPGKLPLKNFVAQSGNLAGFIAGCYRNDLELIRRSTRELHRHMHALWREELRPELERAGVHVVAYEELDAAERERAKRHFDSNAYPIVTPLAVDSSRPFPLISNLSLSLAVTLAPPTPGKDLFVRLKVPHSLGRWFEASERRFLPIEQLLRHHVRAFFPGMEVKGAWLFRVTRNADIRFNEEEAEDLISLIGEELRGRRFAPVVRLEVESDMPVNIRDFLARNLKVSEADVFESSGELGLAHVASFADLALPEHRFEPWSGTTAPRIASYYQEHEDADMFALLRNEDVLVIDLPPGTGDVVLTTLQEVPVDGVVVVTTPFHASVDDTTRTVELFRDNDVPVLGVVENMTHVDCECSGERNELFPGESPSLSAPVLAALPFDHATQEPPAPGDVPDAVAALADEVRAALAPPG
jgi:polyphosphate kinase